MLYFVYELVDPRTNAKAYVGITDNPNRRLQEHINDIVTNDNKRVWIEQLQSEDLEPRMIILEVVETREEALGREKHWIRHYTDLGEQLTNITHCEETVRKCSNGSKGHYNLQKKEVAQRRLPTSDTMSEEEEIIQASRHFLEEISVQAAAEKYNLTSSQLTKLARAQKIRARKVGRDWILDEASVRNYVSHPRKTGPKMRRLHRETNETAPIADTDLALRDHAFHSTTDWIQQSLTDLKQAVEAGQLSEEGLKAIVIQLDREQRLQELMKQIAHEQQGN